jgi:hypothetical protein
LVATVPDCARQQKKTNGNWTDEIDGRFKVLFHSILERPAAAPREEP